jgi:H+/Cl- antiporter ClcA
MSGPEPSPEPGRPPPHPSRPRSLVAHVRAELHEQVSVVRSLTRWLALGGITGVLAGASSFVFLEGLDRITRVRVAHGWLLWLLPMAGLVLGTAHHLIGGHSERGSALLIDQIHAPVLLSEAGQWVPRRMAPLVLLGTWVTHLFGGSAGREGTAIQMSASLTDNIGRTLHLVDKDRRVLLIAAIGGGFGAVFGVPLAGTVFALEMPAIGRARYDAILPALTASLVGDRVVSGLGYHHAVRPQLAVSVTWLLIAKVLLAGVAFGLTGAAFAGLLHGLKAFMARHVRFAPIRPVIGGVAVIGLAALFGRDYLGLSLPLIDRSLAGHGMSFSVFALKIIFTAITLGCGFPGGEVTPLFVIGSTLGAALAGPLHLPIAVAAAVGFVAVFAAAANTPLACTVMGIELFGSAAAVPLVIACVMAYLFSSHRGIYVSQRVHTGKGPLRLDGRPTLHELAQRRRASRARGRRR